MNRKETIQNFIYDENYVPMKAKDIAHILQIPQDDINELKDILSELENEGKIFLTAKNKYIPTVSSNIYTGIFQQKEGGFGFVVQDNNDDFFIPPQNTLGAMDGDKVAVEKVAAASKTRKKEGRIIKILKRANQTIVGTYSHSRNFGFVIPDNKKVFDDIFIPKAKNQGAKDGQKVVANITKYAENGKNPEGEIIEILGNKGDIGLDVLCILKKHGIRDEFPDAVINYTNNIPDNLDEKEIKSREDFRNKKIITIDGADAKDLDDAVCVEKCGENYELSVHIADVSHYVKPNSPLDKEAILRGTSVYFTDRVVPMLPKKLSNNLCSLNPREDKLTLSVIMLIDKDGNLLSSHITESVISSIERMTYEDVEKIINGDEELINKYSHIYDDIMNMRELARILKEKRKNEGSIDFNFPETKIEVDKTGKPVNVYKYRTGESNGIIEEFMLMANKTVAETYFWLDIPFVYRVHEVPSEEKIHAFNEFLKNLDLRIKGSDPHPMEFSKMLSKIKDTDYEMLVSKIMLRSLMKAKYSDTNMGHFGLAFKYYCHFTSPIRRYPDLAIHRIIKDYLKNNVSEQKTKKYSKYVHEISESSSSAELRAMEAEREVDDMKKAEYMKNHIGQEYSAIISSITNFGMFAELPNGIEGLIRLSDMEDDYYIFDEQNYTLTGEHFNKTYKIGDEINIIVASAAPETGQIDFYPA